MDNKEDTSFHRVLVTKEIRKGVNAVKLMLGIMEDGEITISTL
ncbi:hypothetical protein MtrunA17_Chr6g0471801 [Medicago truncatula]|uniref:Uncharacterized protein n=1 Tax=Medicago truncatula TaxID=3880 RepID=A0A396HEM2_MEDTR|nr:hypothetical protein MtrunA17_Chr6g0471801 [Medicago truncatula]